MKQLKLVKPGQAISSAAWNELAVEVNRLCNLAVSSPLHLLSNAAGIQLGITLPRLLLVGKADANITAVSSATPGSGTVSVWVPPATTGAWTDSGENVTAYNFFPAEVVTGNFVMLKLVSGRWIIDYPSHAILGKTDAAHAKGASGTVSVWIGTPGSETDSTLNVTAYNRFADIASGAWVWLNHNGYGWYETAAEC